MIRRAIIIGAPGKQYAGNYLYGVDTDLKNYINFLKSPTGGAWESSEIISIKNPTKESLLEYVHNLNVDYLLFIFSGHGAYRVGKGTLLAINRYESVLLSEVINPYIPKQLFIIDSCRSFVSSGFSGFDGIGDPFNIKAFPSALTKQQARHLFVNYLSSCQPGVMVCYSSSPGQLSFDSEEGGYFTTSLLDATNSWVRYPDHASILPIEKVFTNAKSYIFRQLAASQTPVIRNLSSRKTTGFPFAFKRPYSPFS